MITDKWSVSYGNMDKILDKIERIAACYEFTSKELLQIRLLCEETLSVLAPAMELLAGRCWAATDSEGFSFTVTCLSDMHGISGETREKLLNLDTGKRRGGIFGAIRKALDALLIQEPGVTGGYDTAFMGDLSYHGMGGHLYYWQPEQDFYTLTAKKDKSNDLRHEDDGLEISIVEAYADSVNAAVRPGGRLEITVVKKYSKVPEGVEFV